jgi:hypothetical protein
MYSPLTTSSQEVLVGQLDYREFIKAYLEMGNKPMTPYTLSLYAGNAREYIVNVQDKDMNPVDITGATAYMTLKITKDEPIALQKTGTISMPTNGEIRFYFHNADTANLEFRQYVFDVKVLLLNGNAYTVVEGVFNLKQPVII